MLFSLSAQDQNTRARAGLLTLPHGQVETPVFMPVGTVGSVKAISHDALKTDVRAPLILANTYHLYLRPGMEVIQAAGGIHRFSSWDRPMLTDSGGYQVYSLSQMRKISEEGVRFRSHIDGSAHVFTPENVMDIQYLIGADIIMAFDECAPWPCTYQYAKTSMDLTHRWLDRCKSHVAGKEPLYGYHQVLAPIIQGSTFSELRKISAEEIVRRDFAMHAIGGLSVGEPAEEMYAMTSLVCDLLPVEKPRYLMGVGTPSNLLECIALGIDMFDCVLPTRNARHGLLYTWNGVINVRNEKWKNDHSPLDPDGSTWSRQYSKAYVRHLNQSGEILSAMISTMHNLHFYLELVRTARTQILSGTFASWKQRVMPLLEQRL